VDKTPLNKYFEENQVFRESHSGLMVYDPDKDEVVFNHNEHRHFTPASNTKLLTYLAANLILPDSIPAIKYCHANDTLFFTGTGDPTLLYGSFDYGNTMSFLKNQHTPLVYIARSIEDQRLGPGWSWDDYPYYYSAEKASFPIYGNMAYFRKSIDQDFVDVSPPYFSERLILKQDNQRTSVQLDRDETSNKFTMTFGNTALEIDEEVPFIYSDDLAIKLLTDTLQKTLTVMNQFPGCKTKILYSVPTDSVSKYILINSDNFLAEQMLISISNQLSDTLSSKKSIEFMMKNHLSGLKKEIYWVDGSGLSRYNQLTPNTLIYVLKQIYQDVPLEKLYQLLPASGKTGTLKTAFTGTEGKIHAKTGSMRHVYNLSGFLETNSGKTLLFSFMNNNFNVSFSELKLEMEKVLSAFIND